MTITNSQSGTNIHEIVESICRINTRVQIEDSGEFLLIILTISK